MRVMQSFGMPRATTNPYIVMLRDALVRAEGIEHIPFDWRIALTGRFDVFHVHWADTLLAGRHWWTRAGKRAATAAMLVHLRLRGVAVVQTVHNVSDPAGGMIDRALIRSIRRRTDLRIRISETTPDVAGTPSVLILHGHYRDWFRSMRRAEAVPLQFGCVGLLKPYKGIESLLSAFEHAQAAHEGYALHIAGHPSDPGIASVVQEAATRIPGVEVVLRYLSEDEFAEAITSSSIIALPYRLMHNSGAALAALSLDRPVLVPANDANEALAAEVGKEWVRMFEGEIDAPALVSAAEADMPQGSPDLSRREWTDAGARHVDAYRLAIALRRRRRRERTANE